MCMCKKQRVEEAPAAAAAEPSSSAVSAPSAGAAPEAAGSSSNTTTVDIWPMIAEWVQAKRSAGVTPAAVLDPLGLQLTREATIRDEDSVWAMVALAVAIKHPSPPVCDLEAEGCVVSVIKCAIEPVWYLPGIALPENIIAEPDVKKAAEAREIEAKLSLLGALR